MAWLSAPRPAAFTFFLPTRPSLLPSLSSLAPPPPPPSVQDELRLSLGFGRRRAWEAKGEPENAFALAGSLDLEAEIYDFMLRSPNPRDFPTRRELVAAGREDLARAIAKQGGWLAFGWDLEEEEEEEEDGGSLNSVAQDLENGGSSISLRADDDSVEASSSGDDSVEASYSGRLMEMEAGGDDGGIEGILNRLERERSLSFGLESMKGEEVNDQTSLRSGEHDPGDGVLTYSKRTPGNMENFVRSLSPDLREDLLHEYPTQSQKGAPEDADGMSPTSEKWRTWSLQRADNSLTEFEAAEIVPNEDRKKLDHNFVSDVLLDEKLNKGAATAGTTTASDPYHDANGSSQNQIRLHLQHLESELTSALHQLRSKTNSVVSHKKDAKSSVKELHGLSDALEFQQTEIMKTRDKLRSTRAKLAVLEGKMALEIIEAQKIIEEKTKRLDTAQKALSILRSACIVWPNSASEVLLAGSFDGWTSQRRMERSDSGIFSLHLKLYPGRYEIKFIVDGVWTIDPLRPIVHNNGYQNNLLIIS